MVTKEIGILMITETNLMITETNLNDSFLASQFLIQGFFTPFKLEESKNGGGVLYIRSHITTQLNKYIIKNQIEAFLWR